MKYNSEQILNALNHYTFLPVFRSNNKDDLFNACFNHSEYTMAEGATKCVIIPKNEDYVIKIPYTGTGDYYSRSCDSEGYSRSAIDYYEDFYNADNGERQWDYCMTEVWRYNIAEENGMERFFAKTQLIGFTKNDYPIYVQPKCRTHDCSNIHYSHEEMTKMRNTLNSIGDVDEMPLSWLISFIKKYGLNTLITFVNFVNDNCWNHDLRSANVGYLNNAPVLIDYSGFYE